MIEKLQSSRRAFLQSAAIATVAGVLSPRSSTGADTESRWRTVASQFTPSRDLLNLNNAGVSPQPLPVQDALIRAYRLANEQPDINMWEVLDGSRPRTKEKLAALADCSPQEIALNRNATEGLCTVVNGIELNARDEVILSLWDYDSARNVWQQRATRHGIVIRRVEFDGMASDDAIVDAYRSAITTRTRVMHLTHMLHFTGRVLPLDRLCQMAQEHGVQTLVDAAQSFAQVPLSFRRMGCDYLAVSLHKWLCAPFGTGMLIIKQSRIDKLWPLMAPMKQATTGIARFDGNSLGTYSSPAEHAIEAAVDFHNALGTAAIHERLRSLSRYWIERAQDIRGFKLHTPLDDPQTAAITLFSLDGVDSDRMATTLRNEHHIRVRVRQNEMVHALRVSPHIYTTWEELDRFVGVVRAIAERG